MMRTVLTVAATLLIAAIDSAYAASIQGTKERITFEGLVNRHGGEIIPNGYDGMNWFTVWVYGKKATGPAVGFQSVIRGAAAAVINSYAKKAHGGFTHSQTGPFSLKSGHFAAYGGVSEQVTFSAYRNGKIVGTLTQTLDPVRTQIVFDSTFSRIDTVFIDGTGDGITVAMDGLVVRF